MRMKIQMQEKQEEKLVKGGSEIKICLKSRGKEDRIRKEMKKMKE